ncbi:MAG: ribosome recycling factor [Patescibacteria group bacterium]
MNPLEEFKTGIAGAIQELKKEVGGVRANRPSAVILEDIKVNYYGEQTPMKHLGSISVQPPRELIIQIWDASAVAPAAKAIESASLGLTPNTEGNTIRIFLPELSSERREELKKYVKKIAEQFRIQVRQLRDVANKQIESQFDEGELGEDQKFKLKEDVQKHTETTNKEIEKMVDAKMVEIDE